MQTAGANALKDELDSIDETVLINTNNVSRALSNAISNMVSNNISNSVSNGIVNGAPSNANAPWIATNIEPLRVQVVTNLNDLPHTNRAQDLALQKIMALNRGFVTVYIRSFRTGNEKYLVCIGGKKVQEFTADRVPLFIRLSPGESTVFSVRRSSDGLEVFSVPVRQGKNDLVFIDYTAAGTVRIEPVSDTVMFETYTLYFQDFRVEPGTVLSNIPAGTNYRVRALDSSSNAVYDQTFYLSDREVRTVAPADGSVKSCSVTVFPVENPMNCLSYRYFFYGQECSGGSVFSNLHTNYPYAVSVIDSGGRALVEQNLVLAPGESRDIRPFESFFPLGGSVFYRIDEGIFGLELDYFPLRQLWLGLCTGVGSFYSVSNGRPVFYLFPALDAGYYFLGGRECDWKLGAGLTARYYFALPAVSAEPANNFTNNSYLGAGVFAEAGWKWLFFRPAVYLDFTDSYIFKFSFVIGFRL